MNAYELAAAGRVLLRLEETPGPLETPCWIWPGAKSDGYGRVHVGPTRNGGARVHRLLFRLLVGEVPEGLELDHLCRVRACANPAHLEPVTTGENQRRGDGFVGRRARQTRCIHGHRFTKANTLIRSNGTRACRKCRIRRDRERVRERVAA